MVNPAWPSIPIKLFGARSDSGTFDSFTEAIVGKAKSSRGNVTASEDDNVLVQDVSPDVDAIGYFVLDPDSFKVRINGTQTDIGRSESELLKFLISPCLLLQPRWPIV